MVIATVRLGFVTSSGRISFGPRRGWPGAPLTGLLLLAVALGVAGCQGREGQRAAGAVTTNQTGPAAIPDDRAQAAEAQAVSFTMGTYAQIRATAATRTQAEEAVQAALSELDRLAAQVDRFRDDTQVAEINRHAGDGTWIRVSPDLVSMLLTARRVHEVSHGAFDPTIAPLVDLWGFVETEETAPTEASAPESPLEGMGPTHLRGHRPPSKDAIAKLLPLVSFSDVEIDEAGRKVRLRRPGQALDLGGIAKGYAVAKAAEVLRRHGVTSALLDLGGNIYALGKKNSGEPWRAGVQDPRDPSSVIAIVPVADEALATSGDYERYFEYDGTRYSHLLDPHTGWPAGQVLSVTVITPDGGLGDALSTAAFVLGPVKGLELLESLPGVEGIFVLPDFSVKVTSGLKGKVELAGRGRWAP